MRTHHILSLTLTLAVALPSYAKFEVHEWGTFTSMVGSDGKTIDGMYHEDEKLPDFVHGFGEVITKETPQAPRPPSPAPTRPHPCRSKVCFSDQILDSNIITQKMETPVIYFYSDRAREVDVHVQFPEGVVTETFPAPYQTYPTRENLSRIANGDTRFHVQVMNEKTGNIPFVRNDNIYSHARNVESNLIKAGNEQEKFIFYRGLGRFQPELRITSAAGVLSVQAPARALPQAALLVYVDSQGESRMIDLKTFVPNQIKTISSADLRCLIVRNSHSAGYCVNGTEHITSTLTTDLVQAGLNPDEAKAMLDTWKNGYLRVPGLRLLYILPRNEVDRVLPLTLSPQPEKLARVFVGRMEILLDTQEQSILRDVQAHQDQFDLKALGRFAEPILRRVQALYQNESHANDEISQVLTRLIDRSKNPTAGSGVIQ